MLSTWAHFSKIHWLNSGDSAHHLQLSNAYRRYGTMTDEKLAREEAQRSANYEAIKSNVKAEVGAGIMAEPDDTQAARIEDAAHHMRRQAVDEVVQTDREVKRGRIAARISQVVDYIFFLI